MKIVEVINLEKEYKSKNIKVNALKGVDLSIEKGEFLAIVGPSGSGKSTLLHLLGGLERPTGGTIMVNGKNLYEKRENDLAEYRSTEVGFVFQNFNLIPMLNVEENIELPVLIRNEKVDKEYVAELIRVLGLEERKKHMPGELSGGQQQRVSIARALVTKPSIILADEPTGNLDQKTSEEIITYLRELSEKYNQTVVMITHNMEIAMEADRVIRIIDGQIQNQNRQEYIG